MIIKFSNEGGIGCALVQDLEAVLDFRNQFPDLKVKAIATVKPGDEENPASDKKHANWGASDDLPVLLRDAAENDTVILPGIRFKSEMQYGGGIAYGTREIDDDGDEYFKTLSIPEIDNFLRESKVSQTLMQILMDLNFSAMAFPQICMNAASGSNRKIKRLICHTTRAMNCRVDVMDKQGNHRKVEVNMDMGRPQYNELNSTFIDALPEYDEQELLKSSTKQNFISILKVPDLGRMNHMVPDWNTARVSGWLEISKSIALFKKYLMDNQVSIKYHIEIDDQYWPARFGKEYWDGLDTAGKQSEIQQEVSAWSDFMRGAKGAGNIQMTQMKWNEHTGVHRSYWKITELKGHISKDGIYVEDSREASEHKMSALGIHPDMIGNAPGSKLGAGSGSGNRVAFNQRLSMAKFIQDLALSPLEIVADFNGWNTLPELNGKRIQWRIRNSLIETLDTGSAATKPEAIA